ncbi:MAG: S1C family serine protease [Candidatus Coproplasma sp.]
MKKIRALVFAIIASVCTASFCGCNLITSLTQNTTPVSDYKSETEITADSLMNVREKIREFNISIDTMYYKNQGWFSRYQGTSLGSGVVFEEDENYYYALTNNHVITNVVDGVTYSTIYTVTDIYGTTYGGQYHPTDVSVVCSDGNDNDIAIIRFKKQSGAGYVLPKANYTARKDTNMVPGEFVLAVGNPSGVNNIVTYGEMISWAQIKNVSYSVLHHNALINPGNSGGALCDIDGNLLGLNTWGAENTDDDNYTISLQQINEFIDAFHASQELDNAA